MTKKEQIGRLAFRVEGEMWNAYWAKIGTMDDAILLGSIKFVLVEGDQKIKQAFMGLMQSAIDLKIWKIAGAKPDWPEPASAPEHERAGRA